MSTQRHSRSIARLLLAGFLLPFALLIAGPAGTAAAVTGHAVSFGWDSKLPGAWVSCSVTVFYVDHGPGTPASLGSSGGDCASGWAADAADDGGLRVSATGVDLNGQACAYADVNPEHGTPVTFGANETFSFEIDSFVLGCAVSQFCWYFPQGGAADWDSAQGCESVSMGPPGGESLTCSRLDEVPTPTYELINPSPSGGALSVDVKVHFTATASAEFLDADLWKFYVFVRTPGNVVTWYHAPTLGSPTAQWVKTGTELKSDGGWVEAWSISNPGTVLGLGYYNSNMAGAVSGRNNLPQDHVNGILGTTNPTQCAFYWGAKVATVPDSDVDEPVGPIGPEAPPTPVNEPPEPPGGYQGCDFSVLDPSTWLEAGMCAAVGILGEIFGALKALVSTVAGLPATIVTAVGNMLEELFVPDSGYLADAFAGVNNAWTGSSPGQWAAAIGGWSAGSVSGCEGIPLDVNLGHGIEIHEHLGAACEGQMASTASLVRTVVSAGVVIGGGMACLRAIGSGLGWNPNIGRGGQS